MAVPRRVCCPSDTESTHYALVGYTNNVCWIECLVCGYYDWAELL